MTTDIIYTPIGIVHSPVQSASGGPIQPRGAEHIHAKIEIFPEFAEGLQDLADFSHVIVLYHFHQSRGFKLKVIPFLDTVLRGVFATRAPRRPNAIGFSILPLHEIRANQLHVSQVDMLDKTPVLDIKPYIPWLNPEGETRTGWLKNREQRFQDTTSDDRFLDDEGVPSTHS